MLDLAGAPAPGAEVVLRWRAHPELPGDLGRALPEPAVQQLVGRTDERGRFQLESPHAGPCLVLATRAGTSSCAHFPVLPGEWCDLQLEPDFVVRGRVLGSDGRPAKDAVVRLAVADEGVARVAMYRIPEQLVELRTDETGAFAQRLEHGYLRRTSWNAAMAWQAQRGAELSWPPSPARPTSDVQQVELRLRRLGAPEDGMRDLSRRPPRELPRGLALKAQLVDESGAPLRAARLLLATCSGGSSAQEGIGATDGEGRVAIACLQPQQTFVGCVELDGRFVQFVCLAAVEDVDLGRIVVHRHVIEGRVANLERQPLRGARILLRPRSALPAKATAATRPPPRIAWTDSAGRFRFADTMGGTHDLLVDAGADGLLAVPLPDGPPREPLHLTMPDGAAARGQVLDDAGAPAGGAKVFVWRSDGFDSAYANGPDDLYVSVVVLADAEGRFAVRGLPAGDGWSVSAWLLRGGKRLNVVTSIATGGEPTTVRLAPYQGN